MTVMTLVRRHTSASGEGPLVLDSLSLVALAEDLEAEFGFVVHPNELSADNFGSMAALVAYTERKRRAAP